MKKILRSVLLIALAVCFAVPVAACNPPAENSGTKTLQVYIDGQTCLVGFDDIDQAIQEAEANLADGYMDDTPHNRAKIENTKLLRDYIKSQGYALDSLSWGWGDQLTQKMLAAFLSQQGPDIMFGESQMQTFASQGYLSPYPEDLQAWIVENVSPLAYKDMMLDGKIYGVTLDPSISLLVWNKDIVKRAGLDENKAPETMDEWFANMKAISDNETLRNEKIFAGGWYAGPNTGGYLRTGAVMRICGGSFKGDDGAPRVNTAENLVAFEYLNKMASYNFDGVVNAPSESYFFSAFDTGNLAYMIDGMWTLNNLKALGLNCGYALLPTYNGNSANMLIGAGYMSVPEYSENKEEAFALIKFMLEEAFQTNIAKAGIRPPVTLSVLQADWYKEQFPQMQEFATYGLEHEILGLDSFSQGDTAGIWTEFGKQQSLAIKKGTDISAMASLLETAQTNMMKRYNAK